MVHFAKRVRSIESSPTVHIGDLIAEMKARGEKVLSLAIGEPDFPTPAHIVDAAKKALDADFTKYTPAAGIRELREAVAEKVQKENHIPAKPENVLVAPTKHTLFMTCMALLDTGDEAIIPDPGWVSYAPMVTLAGARPVPVHAADDEGFVPAADAVAEAITSHTRLLMLNSPSNPAGSVYSRPETKALRDRVRPEGGRRGPPRTDSPAPGHGEGIPGAPRPGPQGDRENRRSRDVPSERSLLRLPSLRGQDRQRDLVRADSGKGFGRGHTGERLR